jgi:hypothetical protein
VWDNCARVITPSLTPSPLLEEELSDEDLVRAMLDIPEGVPVPPLPEGMSPRAWSAAMSRETLRPAAGALVDEYCDAEMVDNLDYTLFPNFHPWGGYNRIVYRFRPYQNRYDKSIMECYYLSPFAGERPAPAPIHWLGEDEPWTDAAELGMLAKVFTQDTFNLPHVQTGLEAAQYDSVVLARYQESKLRHFHALLAERLGS